MKPREMKRLKNPEMPINKKVYKGVPVAGFANTNTPQKDNPVMQKQLSEVQTALTEAKSELEGQKDKITDLKNKLEEAKKHLETEKQKRQQEQEESADLLNSKTRAEEAVKQAETRIKELEESATDTPKLEEIKIAKIKKSKVADGKIMLLCELRLSPTPFGDEEAVVLLNKAEARKIAKIGEGNGGSKS